MSAPVLLPSYLQPSRSFRKEHTAAFIGIGLLHLLVLTGLLIARAKPPMPAPSALMVSFIAEQPKPLEPKPAEVKPLPQSKPKPKPHRVTTTQATPSAIQVPPQEDPAPVEEPPPSAPESGPAEPALVPPNFVAAYLNNPAPLYPPMSKRLREQGTVFVLVLVSAAGHADEVRVDKSSGYSRLDDAAVDVIKNGWRFVPAKQGDNAVAAWVRIPMSFALNQH